MFVELEATPRELNAAKYPAPSARIITYGYCFCLREIGIERARSTVHNWVQEAELQLTDGKQPDHVALDESVIHLDDQRYWLYAAVDPNTNEFLHFRLFLTRTTDVPSIFLSELREKHDVADAGFSSILTPG